MARLGAAMVACLTLFVAMAAAAGPVEFIGAVTDQRARLVIKAPRVLPFANDQIGRGLILTFDPPLRGDPAPAQAALRGFVEAIELEDGGATVVVTLAAGQRARVGRKGTDIVVEIAATDVDLAKAPDAAPIIPARVGRHPRYERVVFDWPRRVGYRLNVADGRARVTFQAPGRIDVAALARRLPAGFKVTALAGATPGLTFDLPGDVSVRGARLGPKIVLDFTRPGLAAKPKSTAKPPVPVKTKSAAKPPAPVKTPPAAPAKTAGAEQPASVPSPAKPALASQPKTPQNASPSAKTPSGPAVKTAAKTPTKALERPVVPARVTPDATFLNMLPLSLIRGPAQPIAIEREGQNLALRLDWPRPTHAAVFARAGYLWVVFDEEVTFDLGRIAPADRRALTRIEQIPAVGGSALRVALTPGLNPRVRRDGNSWIVDLLAKQAAPPVALEINPQMLSTQGPRLFVPLASGVGGTVVLSDPTVGDRLLVAPLSLVGRGVEGFRRLVDMDLLATVQGIAVQPRIDGVTMKALPDGLVIGHPDGLRLSPPAPKTKPTSAAVGGLPPGLPPGRIFDMAGWRRGGEDRFMDEKQRLQKLVSDSTSLSRNAPRLALSQFYFAHGLAAEALGLLTIIAQDDEQLIARPDVQAMRGAAQLMLGREAPALANLAVRGLDNISEAELWRGATKAAMGQWKAAGEHFARAGEVPGGYPRAFAARIAMLAAETAVRAGDYQTAGNFLEVIARGRPDANERARLNFLRGRVLQASGDTGSAVALWQVGALSDDRWAQVRSEQALVKHQLTEDEISNEDAIERLEALRFTWRGDAVEFNLLKELGLLYLAEQDFEEGLGALKQAVTYFPKNPQTAPLTRRMTKAFHDIFVGGAAADMTPLNALGLYDRFRELTPVGKSGDQIIESLADRLVEVDLLDRAALLLQRQVRFRVKGAEKARVGARLALINLLNRRPPEALAALDASVAPGLGAGLAAARNRLRARAMFEMGDANSALVQINRDKSRDADELRADIHWRTQSWAQAAPVFERLVGKLGTDGRSLDDEAALLILNWVVSASMSEDRRSLVKARQRYGKSMRATPYGEAFELMTGDSNDDPLDFLSLSRRFEEIGRVKSFLTSYREKLKVGPLGATTTQ